jgi:hypothetical protein
MMQYSTHPQNLTLTSPTMGGSSVGIVRSLSKATESSIFYFQFLQSYVETVERFREYYSLVMAEKKVLIAINYLADE